MTKRQRVRYELTMTGEGVKATRERTKWFGAEFMGGYAIGALETPEGDGGSGGAGGLMLSVATLKWGALTWTVFETGGAFGGGGIDWVWHSRIGWQPRAASSLEQPQRARYFDSFRRWLISLGSVLFCALLRIQAGTQALGLAWMR